MKTKTSTRKYTIEGQEVSKAEFEAGIKAGKSGVDAYVELTHTPTPDKYSYPGIKIQSVLNGQWTTELAEVSTNDVLRWKNSHEALLEALKKLRLAVVQFNQQQNSTKDFITDWEIHEADKAISLAEARP